MLSFVVQTFPYTLLIPNIPICICYIYEDTAKHPIFYFFHFIYWSFLLPTSFKILQYVLFVKLLRTVCVEQICEICCHRFSFFFWLPSFSIFISWNFGVVFYFFWNSFIFFYFIFFHMTWFWHSLITPYMSVPWLMINKNTSNVFF